MSKLQDYMAKQLYSRLGSVSIYENHRPDWLVSIDGNRLELDIFIPEMNIAIEVNGDQHYSFIPFFHKNDDNFHKQKENDENKRAICAGKGIRLYQVASSADADVTIKEIMSIAGKWEDKPADDVWHAYKRATRADQPKKSKEEKRLKSVIKAANKSVSSIDPRSKTDELRACKEIAIAIRAGAAIEYFNEETIAFYHDNIREIETRITKPGGRLPN